MRDHPLRLIDVAAVLVIGGLVLVVLPNYALSILQIVIVTLAVIAGLQALRVSVPSTGWLSPFKWSSPFRRRSRKRRDGGGNGDMDLILTMLDGWRIPMRRGSPMPPEPLRILKPLIRTALDLDAQDDEGMALARPRVSPLAWEILTMDPGQHTPWFKLLPPNRRETAETVHLILDEVERMAAGEVGPPPSLRTNQP